MDSAAELTEMGRVVLAAILDALAAALLGYLGFRIALAATPCGELGDCFPLTPAIVLCVLVAVGLYFGLGYLLWHSSPARAGLRVRPNVTEDDEFG